MSQYEDEESDVPSSSKRGNNLPFWGNVQSMNLNPLILTNILNSPYYKTTLGPIKTFHEIVDQIYYKVEHLEPWEKGSRSTANQTGMCGGVRGVGAGGIVSSCFCILYKLSSLRLTKNQVTALINHCDSPYIRGVGFMYIRYTQPPEDFLDWYDPYIEDGEEIDVKAGTGKSMTMGDMLKSFLTRLEWFDTRFPRIPVNVQKQINLYMDDQMKAIRNESNMRNEHREHLSLPRDRKHRDQSPTREKRRSGSRERKRSPSYDKGHSSSKEKKRSSPYRDRKRSPHRERKHHSERRKDRKRSKSRSPEGRRSRSRSRDRHSRVRDFQDELRAFKEHKKSKKRNRSRSRGKHH